MRYSSSTRISETVHLHPVTLHSHHRGETSGRPGADVESGAVTRALYLMTLYHALSQGPAIVSTNVLQGVDLPIHVSQGYMLILYVEGLYSARRKVFYTGYGHKPRHGYVSSVS